MAEATGKTILVVDDEPDIREFLKVALIDGGFNVITAENGFKALEALRKHRPDLISLDLIMPEKSGVVFYRDLIKNKDWSEIPIIIVTGQANDEVGKADLRELTMSGPGIYLEKPVKPQKYIAAIKQILGI